MARSIKNQPSAFEQFAQKKGMDRVETAEKKNCTGICSAFLLATECKVSAHTHTHKHTHTHTYIYTYI